MEREVQEKSVTSLMFHLANERSTKKEVGKREVGTKRKWKENEWIFKLFESNEKEKKS